MHRTIENIIKRREPVDFLVSGEGTIYLLSPVSPEAKSFATEAFYDAHWFGNSIAVEHRYIEPLVDRLIDEGWRVR
jgi:hypothetical protein